ncbi:MAG: hypothetical protein RR800_00460 [Comamonas sp.]
MALTQGAPLKRHKPMARGSSSMGRGSGFAQRQPEPGQNPEEAREQRLQERAERAAAQALSNAARGQKQGVAPVFSDLVASIPKENAVEHEGYRRLVASFPCMYCGIEGYSQHAHENENKGKGLKLDDRRAMALCCTRPGVEGCHVAFDRYRLLPGGRDAHVEQGRIWAAEMRARIEALGLWPKDMEKWRGNVA